MMALISPTFLAPQISCSFVQIMAMRECSQDQMLFEQMRRDFNASNVMRSCHVLWWLIKVIHWINYYFRLILSERKTHEICSWLFNSALTFKNHTTESDFRALRRIDECFSTQEREMEEIYHITMPKTTGARWILLESINIVERDETGRMSSPPNIFESKTFRIFVDTKTFANIQTLFVHSNTFPRKKE